MMVAVEQASIAKKCNIQFQGQRPRDLPIFDPQLLLLPGGSSR